MMFVDVCCMLNFIHPELEINVSQPLVRYNENTIQPNETATSLPRLLKNTKLKIP